MEHDKSHYRLGVILAAGGNLLGMAASLVTIMVAARMLSKDDLGAFFLVMVVVQFVVLLSDLGLKNTSIKTLSSLPVGSPEFIQATHYLLTITLCASFLACGICWALMPLLKSLWPYDSFRAQLIYAVPIAFLTALFQIMTSILVGGKQFKRLSAWSAGIEVLRAAISAGCLVAGLGVSALFWGMIISRLVGISAVWASTPSWFALSFRYQGRSDLFKFGGWLYGGSLVSACMVRCSDAILTTYLGPAALAVYSAAMQIPTVMQRVFEATRPALLGYVAAHHGSYEHQQIEAARILTAVLAVAATMCIALAEPLMTLLYSKQYESGVVIMQALSLWMVLALLNYFYSVILIGKGQPRRAFLLTVPQLFIMLVAGQLLVSQYHGFGGALALVITAFLGNLIGAKLIAGEDNAMWSALVMNMIRAAGPVVVFFIIVIQIKLSVFVLACATVGALASLGLLRVVTLSDINAVRELGSQLAGRLSARPTTV